MIFNLNNLFRFFLTSFLTTNLFFKKLNLIIIFNYSILLNILLHINLNNFFWKNLNYASSTWFLFDSKIQNYNTVIFR